MPDDNIGVDDHLPHVQPASADHHPGGQTPVLEEWRDIPSCPGYQASSEGRVRNAPSSERRPGFVHRGWVPPSGYRLYCVTVGGRELTKTGHSLVAEAFHGPRPEGLLICHYNGNPLDNRPSNLRYDTAKGNSDDTRRHGTRLGEKSPRNKLYAREVRIIRSLLASGELSQRQIGRAFNVWQSTIGAIARGEAWASVR